MTTQHRGVIIIPDCLTKTNKQTNKVTGVRQHVPGQAPEWRDIRLANCREAGGLNDNGSAR